MRFLIDQDVYHLTIEFLIREGHDVIPVKHVGLERAPDVFLLRKAKEMERILLTRDKDFGAEVLLCGGTWKTQIEKTKEIESPRSRRSCPK